MAYDPRLTINYSALCAHTRYLYYCGIGELFFMTITELVSPSVCNVKVAFDRDRWH